MPVKTTAPARLEARLPLDVYALLKRAAELEGRSLSDFVVSAARAAAQHAIERQEIIRLSARDQATFAEALLAPAQPNEELKRAFADRRRLFGEQ